MTRLPPSAILIIIFIAIIPLINTEEWYMPDSHLISDKQFITLVLEDRSSYKFVKYFSPNCGYCRYLKVVMDKLKHEKEWCFGIFDFNCMWYPQHCQQNVRSGSFPYTAIHDGLGNIAEQIHGFYPEPVIRAIFERIQESCLLMKKLGQTVESHKNAMDNSLSAGETPKTTTQQPKQQLKEQIAKENQDNKSPQKQAVEQPQDNGPQVIPEQKEVIQQEKKQQKKQSIQDKKQVIEQPISIKDQTIEKSEIKQQNSQVHSKQQQKIVQRKKQPEPVLIPQIKPQNDVPHQTAQSSNQPQPRIITQQSHKNHPPQIQVTSQSSENKYIKYFIYGSTVLIAIYYFHHINKGKQIPAKQQFLTEQHQETNSILEHNNELENDQSSQVQQILKEQSNLVASVLDEEL